MTKKSKIIAALAIGAVVLLIGSGIARFALTEAADNAEPERAGQTAQESQADARADGKRGFADLKNSTWTTEDGKATLSITPTNLILEKEDGSSVLFYTVSEESLSGGNISATLAVSSTMNGEEKPMVVLAKADSNGAESLICDELGGSFKRVLADTVDIELQSATEELYGLFIHDKDDFEAVLEKYASERSPHATKAVWDKEVWIDYAAGTMLTNFTLNDAGSTLVSVMADRSGRLAAQ